MKIIIGVAQTPFVRQGSEDLAELLQQALGHFGHQADIVRIPFGWNPLERVLDHVVACELMNWHDHHGVLGDVLIALDFPVTLIRHPRKVVWLAQSRRIPSSHDRSPLAATIRDACREAERFALEEAERVFTISTLVSHRLRKETGVDATPLIPPPPRPEIFYWDRAEDFVLVPAEMRPPERLELLLRAMVRTHERIHVHVCGAAGDSVLGEIPMPEAKRRALEERIRWLGEVSVLDLSHLYARARAVLFTPREEPGSRAILHAMIASKPSITCYDSGAPAELVEHGVTGWIVEPDPGEIAAVLDGLWRDPDTARVRGMTARSAFEALPLDWEHVLGRLLGSAAAPTPESPTHATP